MPEPPLEACRGEAGRDDLVSAASAPGEDRTVAGTSADATRVSEVLRRLRSAVRQRQAELATLVAESEELRLQLAELRAREYLQEPVCVSPRPVLGPILVLFRKAFFHLFMKWYLHSLLMQQNAFNQTASRLVQELFERQRRFAGHLEQLERRLAVVDSEPDRG